MTGFDIRACKRRLREDYKRRRAALDPLEKQRMDRQICRVVACTQAYRRAGTLLTFVSTTEEVDTHELIRGALAQGKRVAVPRCVDGTRDMDFYRIGSLEELVPRTFGVLEPQADKTRRVTDFRGSLCILPGLVFDREGYRLGYGGGYYDRFLREKYRGGTTVGVCYSAFVYEGRLPRGRYDTPCVLLATETGATRVKGRGQNK